MENYFIRGRKYKWKAFLHVSCIASLSFFALATIFFRSPYLLAFSPPPLLYYVYFILWFLLSTRARSCFSLYTRKSLLLCSSLYWIPRVSLLPALFLVSGYVLHLYGELLMLLESNGTFIFPDFRYWQCGQYAFGTLRVSYRDQVGQVM